MRSSWLGILASVVGCSGPPTSQVQVGASVALTLPDGSVLDPKLDGEPALTVSVTLRDAPEGDTCAVTLRADSPEGLSEAWTLDDELVEGGSVELSWDGRQSDGTPFDPGPVSLLATAECETGAVGSDSAQVSIVRLGVVQVDFGEHPDDLGHTELAYHKLSLFELGVTVLDEVSEYRNGLVDALDLADLDDNQGQPREPVEPWADPDSPPWGSGDWTGERFNLPAAYAAGARARLSVMPGTTAVSVSRGIAVPALGIGSDSGTSADDTGSAGLDYTPPTLRMVAEGLTAADEDAILVPGEAVAYDTESLGDTMGRRTLEIVWQFESLESGSWIPVPGSRTTSHVLYVLASEPVLLDGTGAGAAPAVPWIGVLHDLDDSLTGLDTDPATVLDALVDFLHTNPWLVYDPSNGSYSEYEGAYIFWESISSDLSGWLDRSEGEHLYCHSMSCLLSVLAGNVGVDAPQQVLGVGFTTN
ncbi:MAG: hypothetical protein QGG40_03360, partial [Myxococcota bacterium]|nr:hypothetical protein [Myxococcota bacterium]